MSARPIAATPLLAAASTLALALCQVSASALTADPAADPAPNTTTVRLLELTGDARRDRLALGADGSLEISVSLGGRSFQDIQQVLPQVVVDDVLADDLDLDGLVDLYLVSPGADVVLLGDGSGRFRVATAQMGLVESGQGLSVEREDLDEDGFLDLLLHNTEGDVLFWARGDGTYQRASLTAPADDGAGAAPLGVGPAVGQDGDVGRGAGNGSTGQGAGSGAAGARNGPAGPPGGAQAPAGVSPPGSASGASLGGSGSYITDDRARGGLDGEAAPRAPTQPFTNLFDVRYVNDDMNEVDAADIADGSLTGADVSTSSGDVSHTGGNMGVGTSAGASARLRATGAPGNGQDGIRGTGGTNSVYDLFTYGGDGLRGIGGNNSAGYYKYGGVGVVGQGGNGTVGGNRYGGAGGHFTGGIPGGDGVLAYASGGGDGVRGEGNGGAGVRGSSSSGAGVYGISSSGPGVDGSSTDGPGLGALSVNDWAVDASNFAGLGAPPGAVRGSASHSGSVGVQGVQSAQYGNGVYGHHSYSGYALGAAGVKGSTDSEGGGNGVIGYATATTGNCWGVGGLAYGDTGIGVAGYQSSTTTALDSSSWGVFGSNNSNHTYGSTYYIGGGAFFSTQTTYSPSVGVVGLNNSEDGNGAGVLGRALNDGGGIGVKGQSATIQAYGTGYGVVGEHNAYSTGSDYVYGAGVKGETESGAGYGILSIGNSGTAGQKNFLQPHPTDPSRIIAFTSLEGNESGTYFRGSAELSGGVAVIEVPEEFRLVTRPEELTVQLTAMGPGSLWVESKDLGQVVVRGTTDVAFDYVVNGVRLGFSDNRTFRKNRVFVPEVRGVPFGTQFPEELRRILVQNGTLNADFTPNEATASQMGWRLRAPERRHGGRIAQPDGERLEKMKARREAQQAATQQAADADQARREQRKAELQAAMQGQADKR